MHLMLDFSYNLDSVFSHELCKSAFSDGIFWDSGVEPRQGADVWPHRPSLAGSQTERRRSVRRHRGRNAVGYLRRQRHGGAKARAAGELRLSASHR